MVRELLFDYISSSTHFWYFFELYSSSQIITAAPPALSGTAHEQLAREWFPTKQLLFLTMVDGCSPTSAVVQKLTYSARGFDYPVEGNTISDAQDRRFSRRTMSDAHDDVRTGGFLGEAIALRLAKARRCSRLLKDRFAHVMARLGRMRSSLLCLFRVTSESVKVVRSACFRAIVPSVCSACFAQVVRCASSSPKVQRAVYGPPTPPWNYRIAADAFSHYCKKNFSICLSL